MEDRIDKIQELLGQLKKTKKAFARILAKEFELEPISVYNHWLTGLWSIPKDKQERVQEMLEHEIESQTLNA